MGDSTTKQSAQQLMLEVFPTKPPTVACNDENNGWCQCLRGGESRSSFRSRE
jgi:hypothetical protein